MMPDNAKLTDKVFETFGITSRAERLRLSARYMLSGDMIYGLIRAAALEAAGVFRHVVTPDRQVLLALSLFGEMRQLPEVLWYREVLRVFDLERQRKVFFPEGAPLYTYLPSHVQHCGTLLWDYAVRGRGTPAFGRLSSIGYAAIQLSASVIRDIVAQAKTIRLKAGNDRFGRRLWSFLPTGSEMRSARRRASRRADAREA
jgi:hypothetical protein